MALGNVKKERSRAYPVMALDEALVRIESINRNLGINGQFNRESLAVGMGYSSLNGASARRVAALVHYGLLIRDKDQYALSALAKQYLLPVREVDVESATREAALSPVLFAEIYDSFKGQVIPKQFVNRLIQEFGIQQKAAPDVERVFRSTMEIAGIMQSNGILSGETLPVAALASSVSTTAPAGGDASNGVSTVQDVASQPVSAPASYLSVNLPSGLVVSYSQDLASAFAFGTFGAQLRALDDVVAKYVATQTVGDGDGNREEV